jgi:hypothetical protein
MSGQPSTPAPVPFDAMFTPVEVYRTRDGKTHATPDKAREHIADQCRERLAALLAALPPERFTRNDVFRIVMALIPDAESGKRLADSLAGVFP